MKICGIICEFNPFHNGHEYLLKTARILSGCDAVICIMSGNFTQRGDICVVEKHVRAKHAVKGGADCVLELPTAFSVAPAEIFAQGAVKVLSSIPELDTIAFGCENGTADDFLHAAKLLTNESKAFKAVLHNKLSEGESYIKSYTAAFNEVGGNTALLTNPNSILGVEYAKAVIRTGKNIRLLPVKRIGSDYNDGELKENFSSASAIRSNLNSELVKGNVPDYVLNDLHDFSKETDIYNYTLKLILSRTSSEDLAKVYDCTEGLENLLKNLQNLPLDNIIKSATSKRFTSSRIKRILCENFLKLYRSDTEKFLSSELYLAPLAVKKESANAVLPAIAKSRYPVITSGTDEQRLSECALKCRANDNFSYAQWRQIARQNPENKIIII